MAIALTGRDIEQWAASKDIPRVRGDYENSHNKI